MISDTSHSGWGAHLEPLGLEGQGLWDSPSHQQFGLHAVFLVLQHFQNHIYSSCVMVASDNSSVVAVGTGRGSIPYVLHSLLFQ